MGQLDEKMKGNEGCGHSFFLGNQDGKWHQRFLKNKGLPLAGFPDSLEVARSNKHQNNFLVDNWD